MHVKQHLTLISPYPWLPASVRTMVVVYLIPTGPGVQVSMNAIVCLDLPETTVMQTLMIVSLIHVFEVWSSFTDARDAFILGMSRYQYVQLTRFIREKYISLRRLERVFSCTRARNLHTHASAESVLKSAHRKLMLRKIARTGNKICGKHLFIARKFAR